MAATVAELEYTSITADRTTIVITDVSTYDTPARAVVGAYLKGQKIKFDATVESTLTTVPNDGDANTDSAWTVIISKGGFHRFPFVLVPDYSAGTTYAHYDAVFSPSAKKVYVSQQAGNVGQSLANLAYWVEETDPASLALNEGETNESANIISTVYEIDVTQYTEYYFANAVDQASIEGGDDEREAKVQVHDFMEVMVNAEFVASDRSQFTKGERLARRAESFATQEGLTSA